MIPVTELFEFDYFGSEIIYGRGSIARIGNKLRAAGFDRALLVCGSNVGGNDALMNPIKDGLGETLVGVYDEKTTDKTIEDVYGGIDVMAETNPDVIIGIGGGSSLDVARQMGVFQASNYSLSGVRSAAMNGTLERPEPDGEITPAVVIPTTFAGADISDGGSIEVVSASESPTGQPIRTKGSNMPVKLFYDPNLTETTPLSVLAGSSMNGFNKGIETLYARTSNPVTDSTAMHGLRLLRDAYPKLSSDNPDAMERAVIGSILVQFNRKTSIIHAFGHGFSRRYTLQQGKIHAILVPHILKFIFSQIDARRELHANAFDISIHDQSDEDIGERIVNVVKETRDSFDLPTQLREIEPVDPTDFPAIAEFILDDSSMTEAPKTFSPSVDEVESVLHEAW